MVFLVDGMFAVPCDMTGYAGECALFVHLKLGHDVVGSMAVISSKCDIQHHHDCEAKHCAHGG